MINRSAIEKYIPESGVKFDVIVAGGGPAGIGAALASAKQGTKTLLIEARPHFGGVATVSHWMPLNRILQNNGSRGGVHEIFVRNVKNLGSDACCEGRTGWVNGDNLDIHPDYLRLAIFNALEEVGCHYRLYTPVIGTIMDGNRVTGVRVLEKNGIGEFYADAFVDATGDADIAYHAGAQMVKGREDDGAFMPVTLGFVVSNVDTEKLNAYVDQNPGIMKKLIEEGNKDGYSVSVFYSLDPTTIPGVVSINNGGLKDIGIIDATDIKHLTISQRTGIEVAVDFVKMMRDKKIPGMENCYLSRVGADLGIRETRRIVGDYVVTIEDSCTGTEFEDVVARRYGEVDPGGLAEKNDYRHSMKSGHAYPYRAMLPIGIEGLLVAGRCGSTTHLGQAAGKSMGNMMDLGQAAGVAAALCTAAKVTPRQLDVKKIQQTLIDMGVKLFK